MFKDKKFDYLIILFMLIGIIGLIWVIVLLVNDGGKCVTNPIEYYHSLGDDRCFCNSGLGERSPTYSVELDRVFEDGWLNKSNK